jgi:hypothetical protein
MKYYLIITALHVEYTEDLQPIYSHKKAICTLNREIVKYDIRTHLNDGLVKEDTLIKNNLI